MVERTCSVPLALRRLTRMGELRGELRGELCGLDGTESSPSAERPSLRAQALNASEGVDAHSRACESVRSTRARCGLLGSC